MLCELFAVPWHGAKMSTGIFSIAKPAKLMLATLTRHVVASSILFDVGVALRALFCVGTHPLLVLGIGLRVFGFPLLILFTRGICVPFFFALETKAVLAFRIGTDHHRIGFVSDHGVLATRFGTPSKVRH